jgi:hypothetical protein
MQIVNSTLTDIDEIFRLYRGAIEYQKAKGYNLWKEFDRNIIIQEIKEKRNWKIVIDGQMACVFSVAYNDPVIWGEQASLPSEGGFSDLVSIPPSGGWGAIYLHRITTNLAFKGRGFMNAIVEWSKQHCKETDRKFIRMDTWADNKNLTNYYVGVGFNVIGYRQLDKDAKGLPSHYSTLSLVLLEIKV